jgi:hypothetical protein
MNSIKSCKYQERLVFVGIHEIRKMKFPIILLEALRCGGGGFYRCPSNFKNAASPVFVTSYGTVAEKG